jgi:tRNA-modifying protein YgfZ
MPRALLDDRAVLRLVGDATKPFLQGLVTQDVADLSAGTARYGALLSPQGKILADFFIADTGDAVLIDVPASAASDLVRRLTLYRLRAKVTIEDVSDRIGVIAGFDEEAPEGFQTFIDPRLDALGWRAFAPKPVAGPLVPSTDYESRRIALGVAAGGLDYAFGEVFPHEADLDQLNGVDFRKGCFVGQEVVSRMEHRSPVRSRFVPVAITGQAPAMGAPLRAGDRVVGQMGSSAGDRGLALLRLDRVADAVAEGQAIWGEGAVLTPIKPGWARFDWPLPA